MPSGIASVSRKMVLVVGVALIDIKGKVRVKDPADDSTYTTPRVLLAQRPRGKANEGLWEFPGGKVKYYRIYYHSI